MRDPDWHKRELILAETQHILAHDGHTPAEHGHGHFFTLGDPNAAAADKAPRPSLSGPDDADVEALRIALAHGLEE